MKRLFSLAADYIRETDKIMLLLVFAASSFGCIAVMSATAHTGSLGEFFTQLGAMFGGLGIAIIISNINYKTFQKYWFLAAAAGLIPVLLTFFIGFAPEGTDDKAWLLLPGGMSFQPAELMKICFIITFSAHLARVQKNINKILYETHPLQQKYNLQLFLIYILNFLHYIQLIIQKIEKINIIF